MWPEQTCRTTDESVLPSRRWPWIDGPLIGGGPREWFWAWNRLYGRRGFVQYQCVLPKGESASGVGAVLERVASWGCSSCSGRPGRG